MQPEIGLPSPPSSPGDGIRDTQPSPVGYPPLHTLDLGYPPPLLTSGGHHWKPVQTCSLEKLKPPSSDSHQNMYSWQVGSTHLVPFYF